MPRAKFVNHKGRNRHFTNPEELEEQRRQEEKTQQRRCEGSTSSTEKDDKTKYRVRDDALDNDSESETTTESESESETRKAKGVENLIEIENPNRIQKKTKKLSDLNQDVDGSKREMSRREREQLEKEKAHAYYLKLHAAGKTDEARADLARLAIIKQQREEAAKRREDEKKQKEMAQQKKTELAHKALGKKS